MFGAKGTEQQLKSLPPFAYKRLTAWPAILLQGNKFEVKGEADHKIQFREKSEGD